MLIRSCVGYFIFHLPFSIAIKEYFSCFFSCHLDVSFVTIIFTLFIFESIKSHPSSLTFIDTQSTTVNTSTKLIMEGLRSILEQKEQPLQECIDEQKLRFIASKVSIWDFFGIPQAHYLTLDKPEKSRMLGEYYSKLVPQHFGGKNNFFGSAFFCLDSLVWCLAHCLVFAAAWSSDFFWHFREKFWIWWSNRCWKF